MVKRDCRQLLWIRWLSRICCCRDVLICRRHRPSVGTEGWLRQRRWQAAAAAQASTAAAAGGGRVVTFFRNNSCQPRIFIIEEASKKHLGKRTRTKVFANAKSRKSIDISILRLPNKALLVEKFLPAVPFPSQRCCGKCEANAAPVRVYYPSLLVLRRTTECPLSPAFAYLGSRPK